MPHLNLTSQEMATFEESKQPPIPPTESVESVESTKPTTKQHTENKFEESSKSLPPPRSPQQPILQPVAPPLSEIPLNKFIYLLLAVVSLIAIFYTFRLVQYKTDVGGWSNLLLGKKPAPSQSSQFGFGAGKGFPKLKDDGKVETRLHLLAESLGMPPPASDELVGAIASAVREFVPPASLSSIAAKETGKAVRILVEYVPAGPMPGARTGGGGGGGAGFGSKAGPAVSASKEVANVNGVVNAFVGMDDVPFESEIYD